MTGPHRANRKAAEELFTRFAPMFAEFEERGVDYRLVGGLAVVAHCLTRGSNRFRATEDADAMMPQDYSNADFARDYLRVYATDPRHSKAIYDAVFGEDGFDQLSDAENAFVNASFVGADADLDGIDTPASMCAAFSTAARSRASNGSGSWFSAKACGLPPSTSYSA